MGIAALSKTASWQLPQFVTRRESKSMQNLDFVDGVTAHVADAGCVEADLPTPVTSTLVVLTAYLRSMDLLAAFTGILYPPDRKFLASGSPVLLADGQPRGRVLRP